MIPELLQLQPYVLTYKFSQDHLELLFNSIRAAGNFIFSSLAWNIDTKDHAIGRMFMFISVNYRI